MHIVTIAWLFVVVLMSAAEATSSRGSVLGAFFTFLLYGVLPLSVVLYLMATPARRRARQRLQRMADAASEAGEAGAAGEQTALAPNGPTRAVAAEATDQDRASAGVHQRNAGGQPASQPIAPVRKEPR